MFGDISVNGVAGNGPEMLCVLCVGLSHPLNEKLAPKPIGSALRNTGREKGLTLGFQHTGQENASF